MKNLKNALIVILSTSLFASDFPSGTQLPNGDLVGNDGTYHSRLPNGDYSSSNGSYYTRTPNGDYSSSNGSYYTRTPNGDYVSNNGAYHSRTPNGSYIESGSSRSGTASSSGSSYEGRYGRVESDVARQRRNPCYCGLSKGNCMVFRKGEKTAYASFPSNRCGRQECERNFYNTIQDRCESLYALWNGR